MASSRLPPSKSTDLDLIIVSAKHLKNVNWKNGVLKPYVVFLVDPDRRLATKSTIPTPQNPYGAKSVKVDVKVADGKGLPLEEALSLYCRPKKRNLFSVGYKNVVGSRRASWRILLKTEKKEES